MVLLTNNGSLEALRAGSLRPKAALFGLGSKAAGEEVSPDQDDGGICTAADGTASLAEVADVARPHRGAGRGLSAGSPVSAADSTPTASGGVELDEDRASGEDGADGVTSKDSSNELLRSPSGSKLIPPSMRFPFGASFTFWLARGRSQGSPKRQEDLEALGTCNDVHNFWKYWNGIVWDRLPPQSLLAVFRHPERPRAGPKAPGGKWVISTESTKAAAKMLEELSLALVGGFFDENAAGAPCGVALSTRVTGSSSPPAVVEVWNRAASAAATAPVLAELRELLGSEVSIEYKLHRGAAGAAATEGASTPMQTPTAGSKREKQEDRFANL
mmetsp:Transcript_72497/g.125756  ORF Transcript_72497/g.125756 Transcript_72497/m.125756 type:complete len:330 (-) Transcript_72497:108-1097(-)